MGLLMWVAHAPRNFSKLQVSVVMDKNIHGGVNYGENKNRDIVWDATYIHGPTSQNYPKEFRKMFLL